MSKLTRNRLDQYVWSVFSHYGDKPGQEWLWSCLLCLEWNWLEDVRKSRLRSVTKHPVTQPRASAGKPCNKEKSSLHCLLKHPQHTHAPPQFNSKTTLCPLEVSWNDPFLLELKRDESVSGCSQLIGGIFWKWPRFLATIATHIAAVNLSDSVSAFTTTSPPLKKDNYLYVSRLILRDKCFTSICSTVPHSWPFWLSCWRALWPCRSRCWEEKAFWWLGTC